MREKEGQKSQGSTSLEANRSHVAAIERGRMHICTLRNDNGEVRAIQRPETMSHGCVHADTTRSYD